MFRREVTSGLLNGDVSSWETELGADPNSVAVHGESHYPSVLGALAHRNCTRIVHQTVPRQPDDNPFSLTLPNARGP